MQEQKRRREVSELKEITPIDLQNPVNLQNDKEKEEGEKLLKEKIKEADDLIARLKATYEYSEAKEKSKVDSPTPGLKFPDVVWNEPTALEILERPHVTDPSRHYHWLNAHPDIIGMRKGIGYKEVTDEKGNKIQHGDAVLGAMPKAQYEEILARKNRKRHFRRKQAVEGIKDFSRESGVPIYGKIEYDDETIEVGSREK
jgi:hypothetical protein